MSSPKSLRTSRKMLSLARSFVLCSKIFSNRLEIGVNAEGISKELHNLILLMAGIIEPRSIDDLEYYRSRATNRKDNWWPHAMCMDAFDVLKPYLGSDFVPGAFNYRRDRTLQFRTKIQQACNRQAHKCFGYMLELGHYRHIDCGTVLRWIIDNNPTINVEAKSQMIRTYATSFDTAELKRLIICAIHDPYILEYLECIVPGRNIEDYNEDGQISLAVKRKYGSILLYERLEVDFNMYSLRQPIDIVQALDTFLNDHTNLYSTYGHAVYIWYMSSKGRVIWPNCYSHETIMNYHACAAAENLATYSIQAERLRQLLWSLSVYMKCEFVIRTDLLHAGRCMTMTVIDIIEGKRSQAESSRDHVKEMDPYIYANKLHSYARSRRTSITAPRV